MNQSPFELLKASTPTVLVTVDDLALEAKKAGSISFVGTQRKYKKPNNDFMEGYKQAITHSVQILSVNDEDVAKYYMRKQLINRIEALAEQLQPLFSQRRAIEKEQEKLASKGFVSESCTHKEPELYQLRKEIFDINQRKSAIQSVLDFELDTPKVNEGF
jgi:vacuolar-type H+-ATPase subunit I/STV1